MGEIYSPEEKVINVTFTTHWNFPYYFSLFQADVAASLLLLTPPEETKEVLKGVLICNFYRFVDIKVLVGNPPEIDKKLAK